MPSEGPGRRYSVPFTKQTTHGDPAVENCVNGIAAKSTQAIPAAVSVANAAAAQVIAVGEEAVIMCTGLHEVANAKLPGSVVTASELAAGTSTFAKAALYIRHSDNALVLAATALSSGILSAGFSKFGLIVARDDVLARTTVNLNLRSEF